MVADLQLCGLLLFEFEGQPVRAISAVCADMGRSSWRCTCSMRRSSAAPSLRPRRQVSCVHSTCSALQMQPQWFDKTGVPFERMWPDDHLWFPLMLAGVSSHRSI